MSMVIECPRCGHEYEATEAQIRAGAWRACPVCAKQEQPVPTPGGQEETPHGS